MATATQRKSTMRTTPVRKKVAERTSTLGVEVGQLVQIKGRFWKVSGLQVYGEVLDIKRKRAKLAVFQPDGFQVIKFVDLHRLEPVCIPSVVLKKSCRGK